MQHNFGGTGGSIGTKLATHSPVGPANDSQSTCNLLEPSFAVFRTCNEASTRSQEFVEDCVIAGLDMFQTQLLKPVSATEVLQHVLNGNIRCAAGLAYKRGQSSAMFVERLSYIQGLP